MTAGHSLHKNLCVCHFRGMGFFFFFFGLFFSLKEEVASQITYKEQTLVPRR